MDTLCLLRPLIFVAAIAAPLCAREPITELLVRTSDLNEAGRFRAAIDTIEPLLHSQNHTVNDAETGVAWNLRGLALQGLSNQDEARRSYETAIRTLCGLPDQQAQCASALDNLGSLQAEIGQLENSKSLRTRARKMYEVVLDHAGMARVSTELALVAMGQGNRKEARRDLAEASQEESMVPEPKIGDLAWVLSAQCLQYERDGDASSALTAINRAIELWTQHYGPGYYLLAAGYSTRGKAHDMLHDYASAEKDMEHSLEMLTANGQGETRVYYLTEISYSQVLRHLGQKAEASRMESAARGGLENLRHQECGGCTISAASFR
jgi:tetratricopeptide (TPR) repeat protein